MKKLSVLVIVAAILLASCATPKLMVKCDAPNSIPAEATRKIVVAPVMFTDRSLVLIPLIDAGIYNGGIATSKSKQTAIETESAAAATVTYAKAIADKSGKDTIVSEARPETVSFDMFAKPENGEYPKKIAAESGADVVVVVLSRVRTTGVVAYGFSGFNLLDSTMYVFDKDGKVCGSASMTTIPIKSGSSNMTVFKKICDENLVNGSKLVDLLF